MQKVKECQFEATDQQKAFQEGRVTKDGYPLSLKERQFEATSDELPPIEQTLTERGCRYGDFTDHALIAQELQETLRSTEGWDRLTANKKQALTVICDKIARILNGDPEYRDNWHDIAGYAKLAEDRCKS